MSDTKWRISGGLGVPEVVNQVMTQGLGFPLRPVDGTPATGSGEDIENTPIAEGMFMQWMGSYQAGLLYPVGSVVTDTGWTMIANVPTVTKPAPVPTGSPTFALPDTPAFATLSNLSVIYSGHEYEFLESGWLKTLRVWVPALSATTNYRIVAADITNPADVVTQVIYDPVLAAGEWKNVSLLNSLIVAGTKLLVYVDALDSGSDSQVTGGWTFGGSSGNATIPATSQWTKDNQNQTVRIDKTDLDLGDRSSELLGITPGSEIQFVQTSDAARSFIYRTEGPVIDGGTYVEYPVTLINTGPLGGVLSGETSTMTATIPVAQTTDYVSAAGNPAPSWATVTPYLAFDGVDQGASGASFGVDIEFEPAIVNDEWDIMATTEL